MYYYIEASVIEKSKAGNWRSVDIKSLSFKEIYERYENAVVKVTDALLFKTSYLDLYKLPIELRYSAFTLKEYLNVMETLPNLEDVLDVKDSELYARFLFLNKWGFSIDVKNHKFSSDTELLPDQQTDLYVYRKDKKYINYKNVLKNALVTVNGLCFQADSFEDGLMIYGSGKTAWLDGEARIGLIDFNRLGGCQTHAIDSTRLKNRGKTLETFYLDVDYNLANTTAFIVIGGVFYFNMVKIVGGQRLKIDFRNLKLEQHFELIRKRLDVSSLPVKKDVALEDLYTIQELYTAEYVSALLSLEQSFIVLVNSPDVVVEYEKLKTVGIPGHYLRLNKAYPNKPLRMTNGLFGEYNVHKREGFYLVTSNNYLKESRFDETRVYQGVRRGQYIGRSRFRYADARLVTIGKKNKGGVNPPYS